ncbi:LLM class flavin-dependent oxidoreductase [Nocardioides humi]|uniref:LLM class flavin-dependent oxidoreductase n=1 Tax=Nocardioides humi TaxID=449461 RepID=UPI0011288120|nr:LLM class flavin-dependent oxidoreductase [Nocardioides humi]
MKFGYAATFQNCFKARSDYDVWRDELRLTDFVIDNGFDSVWATEHHFTDYEMSPNPLQYLSWVVGRSSSIEIGTMVLVIPWHDPMRIAEEVAVLDHLADGRFTFGIGRGVCDFEYQGMRIPMEESRERFDEIADIVLEALETGRIEEKPRKFYPMAPRDIRPEPFKSFKGRLVAAAGSTPSLPIMARLGAGLLLVPSKSWDQIEEETGIYRGHWAEMHPDTPAPRPLLDQFIFVHEDAEVAKQKAHQYLGTYYREVLKHYKFGASGLEKVKGYEGYTQWETKIAADPDGHVNDFIERNAWGTPDQVIEKLTHAHQRTNCSQILAHAFMGACRPTRPSTA